MIGAGEVPASLAVSSGAQNARETIADPLLAARLERRKDRKQLPQNVTIDRFRQIGSRGIGAQV
jgi:hypothetical protein